MHAFIVALRWVVVSRRSKKIDAEKEALGMSCARKLEKMHKNGLLTDEQINDILSATDPDTLIMEYSFYSSPSSLEV